MQSDSSIDPVILCGGSGTRLWPISRQLYPKPFVEMSNGKTLFANTIERLKDFPDTSDPVIISNEEYRFYVLEILEKLNINGDIILEPEARNTAPALALAALNIGTGGDRIMLVMPSDHYFENDDVFLETVNKAIPLAEAGYIVTFGIKPTRPEQGYGYIRKGEVLAGTGFAVHSFIEKKVSP